MPTAPPTVDQLPVPPSTSDPVNFDQRADEFLPELLPYRDQMNALGQNVYENALEAAAGAALAASALNSPSTYATSTTSLSVGVGSKAFVLAQTDKAFALGQPVTIARTSDPAGTWMLGRISAFNAGTGATTVEVGAFDGSGTHTDWTISLSGPEAMPAATASDIWAGTVGDKTATPAAIAAALAVQTESVSGSVTPDLDDHINKEWTLTGNTTFADPAGKVNGKSGVWWFKQDATGGRTLTLNAAIAKAAGVTITLSTEPGAVDRLAWICRGTVFEITALEPGIGS